MTLPPYKTLDSAYQLHFYLAFKTHRLKPLLELPDARALVSSVLEEVCNRQQYHLLQTNVTADHLSLLLSLKPQQSVSNTVQILKGNLSHRFGLALRHELEHHRAKSLWGKGYFARSAGKVNLEAARAYVESQVNHHGYTGEWTKPLLYQNPDFRSPVFDLAHARCMLDYHLVLVTKFRAPLFDEVIAPKLFDYILAVGRKRGFGVERMSLLPDHMHLLLQAIPSLSIQDCALSIVNNTQQWMGKWFWGVLKQTQTWDVWQPSFYAGTVGEYSTAQMKQFLRLGN